jgi:diguanylate cyclase (GGDEF)-like protein/PAS domain S-box-containing protein
MRAAPSSTASALLTFADGVGTPERPMRAQFQKLVNNPNCTATAVSTFFIAAIVVSYAFDLQSRYHTAIDNAQRSARSFAEVLAEHTARTFEAVDRTLRQAELIRQNNPAADPASAHTAREALRHLQQSSPVIRAIAWTDAAGDFELHSSASPRRRSIADMDQFTVHRDRADVGLYIAPPYRSSTVGDWITAASRRIDNPDGSFAGVIAAPLNPSYFSSIYRSIGLQNRATVFLIHRGGTLLAREPFVEGVIGRSFLSSPLFTTQLPKAPSGVYDRVGSVDGTNRIAGYKAVPDLPLVVTVSYERAAVLEPWFQHLYLSLPLVVLLVLAILLGTGLLRRQTRKLSEKTDMLEATLANISQGVCMFDGSARISVVNQRYIEMYNLSPEVVKPGRTLHDLIHHRDEVGLLSVDPDEYCQDILGKVSQGKPSPKHILSRDGRVAHAIIHPMRGGGWVTTHEDVTEQRKAEIELEDTRNFLKTVIDHVPATILVKDVRDFRYVLLNKAGQKLFDLSPEQVIGKTAHDCFPQEIADAMTEHDKALLETGQQLLDNEYPIQSASSGVRQVTTDTLIVRGSDGKPKYLLTVMVDVTERKRTEAQIVYIAHHDLLTGLPNRTFFMEKIEEAGARLRRWREPFRVLILDLDRFKIVNDSLGHPAGDALLKETAIRLKSSLRETDVLARLGGDEFAIIQAGEADPGEGATSLAERIIDILKPPYQIEGSTVSVGASIGIAKAPEDGTDPNELIKKADLALYRTKSQGRNGFRFFDPQMTKEADARHQLENDLRVAISRGELVLHYQPIIDVKTRKPCGAEALVRWQHPQKGLLPPDQFIPLAEETGLISSLGEWVVQRACADAATWPSHIKVSVNLSALQFRNGDLLDVILCALVESGLPPERLELEITESVLLETDTDPLAVIRRLKSIGVSLALDDFGTGYSSLSYLTKFPFDKIKIDKSFTQNLPRRTECTAIVLSVRALASGLNILTTAEGVETEQQFSILRATGVDLAQGYLFGRPCPISELEFASHDLETKVGNAA